MTDRELEIFVSVAENGKMSEAARKLYITQSSVSQAIASIEKEYSLLLFERLSGGLYLTDDGKKLLSYARSFFAVKKDMDDFLSNASQHHQLNIGATVTVGTCVINQILASLKEKYPDIECTVQVANTHILEDMLLKSTIDVGLVEGIISSPDLISRDVIDDLLVLICNPSHPFYGRKSVKVEELACQKFILREKGSGTRAEFEDQMTARGIPLNISWSCYNSEAICNAVAAGNGISVISKRLVEDDVKSGRLWMCDIEGLNQERQFSVIYHKNKFLSDEMNSFIDACVKFAIRERHQT